MSSKLPTKQDGKSKAKSRLTKSEEIDLQAFCEDICFDDMSFDDWQDVALTLNLTVEIVISLEEAKVGMTRDVGFTRTVDQAKVYVCLPVDVPAGVQDGHKIVLTNQGDCSKNEQGDVHVIIRVTA